MYSSLIELTEALLTGIKVGVHVVIWPRLPLTYYLVEDGDAPPMLALCTQAADGKNDTLYLEKKDKTFLATGGSILGSTVYKLEKVDMIDGLSLLYEVLMMQRTASKALQANPRHPAPPIP